jgi:hypothetical protein
MITLASGKSIDVSPTLLMHIVRSALKVIFLEGREVKIEKEVECQSKKETNNERHPHAI